MKYIILGGITGLLFAIIEIIFSNMEGVIEPKLEDLFRNLNIVSSIVYILIGLFSGLILHLLLKIMKYMK